MMDSDLVERVVQAALSSMGDAVLLDRNAESVLIDGDVDARALARAAIASVFDWLGERELSRSDLIMLRKEAGL